MMTMPPRLNWFESEYCSALYIVTKTKSKETVTNKYSMAVWPRLKAERRGAGVKVKRLLFFILAPYPSAAWRRA